MRRGTPVSTGFRAEAPLHLLDRHTFTTMRSILSVCVLAVTAVAQGYVSPSHFTTVEGTSNNTFPFGGNTATSTPFRYQQIHDDVPTSAIQGLAFRHETTSTGTVRAPFTVTIDAWISTSPLTSATPDITFDNNHGLDKIQVVTNRTISVPGNDPSLVPNPFTITIPFDAGVVFPFAGGGASLCWEVQVTARTNTASVPFDSFQNSGTSPANPAAIASRAFTGCLSTGRTQPILATAQTNTAAPMDWINGTGRLGCNGTQLEANGIVAFVYGTDRTQWSGLPLPLDVPGSTGAPSGTCTLHTDIALANAAIASAAGAASSLLTFSVTPALHGATFNTQIIGLDAAANPLGFTTSNLLVQQLVAPYAIPLGVCRIYSAGSLGATGTTSGTGLVTRFL